MNLGLGTLHFSSKILNSSEFREMIHYCVRNNISYFDTGFYYGEELTEFALGKQLFNFPRESYEIAVKYILNREHSPEEMLRIQFQKLNISYADNLLLHNLTDKNISFYFDFLDFLEKSKREGLAKRIGFSSHLSPQNLEIFLKIRKWDVIYLYLNWVDFYSNTAEEEYKLCEKYKVPVVAMGPLRGGRILTLPKKYSLELKRVHSEWSLVDWSLGWFNSLKNCYRVLTGALSIKELQANIKASKNNLSLSDLNLLRDIAVDYKKEKLIPCTGCGYCENFCPQKIKIPLIIKNYNKFLYEEEKDPRWLLSWMKEDLVSSDINLCVFCGNCEQICPQKIDIPRRIKIIESCINC